MTQYFRKVVSAQRLLARERFPVTGRRVPKNQSKRNGTNQAPTVATAGVPGGVLIAGAVVVLLAVTGVVLAISKSSDGDETAGRTTASAAESSPTGTGASPAAVPVTVPVTVEAATSTVQATTTVAIASTTSVLGPVVRLVSSNAATAATAIPTDPAATATYSGPLPAFNFAIDCTPAGCAFSMRTFAPGTVTDDGLTSVPATDGRFVITSSQASPCTTSSGGQVPRTVSHVIALTLSGSQVVNGLSVPQQITGTVSFVTPDAGYVPRVGDVVDEGADVGCAGQTLIFDIAGALTPG